MSDLVLRSYIMADQAATDLARRARDEQGQGAVEYMGAILAAAALVGIVVVAAGGFGDTIVEKIEGAINSI